METVTTTRGLVDAAIEWCRPIAESASAPLVPILALLAMAAYVGVSMESARERWPWQRTLAFGTAMTVLVVAWRLGTWSGANGARLHAAQHVLVGMVAPLGIVAAAPFRLLLRRLPPRQGRGLVRAGRSLPGRVLTHPATAFLVNTVSLLLLFLTPLYATLMRTAWGHGLLHVHFLAAGVLFVWVVSGADTVLHRPSLRARVALLIAGAGAHAFLAKAMYAYGHPRGTGVALEELQAAAQIMYYGGDVAELVLAVMLFRYWYLRRASRPNSLVPDPRSGWSGTLVLPAERGARGA